MKIIITNNEQNIGIIKDLSDLDKSKTGLMGQIVMELELLKEEILSLYCLESQK